MINWGRIFLVCICALIATERSWARKPFLCRNPISVNSRGCLSVIVADIDIHKHVNEIVRIRGKVIIYKEPCIRIGAVLVHLPHHCAENLLDATVEIDGLLGRQDMKDDNVSTTSRLSPQLVPNPYYLLTMIDKVVVIQPMH